MSSGAEQFVDWMRRRFPQSTRPQIDTATLFGWDPTFINKIVQGKRTPGLANAVRIYEVTGIPVHAWVSDSLGTTSEPVSEAAANEL